MALTDVTTVRCVIADSETGKQIDVSEILTSVSWSTSLLDQPGTCTLSLVEEGLDTMPMEGSNVVVQVGDTKVFDGYIFTRTRSEDPVQTIRVYDRLRYLNNKDTKVFDSKTATEIFTQLCQEQELPFKCVSSPSFKTAPVVHDNKSLYSMIIRALDETIIGTGEYYIVRDNVGTLELIDVAELETDLLIGDASLLTGYDFESSIDQQTYNYIKLVQENKDTQKREVYVVTDSSTVQKWGRLQYFEKMDESANSSQIIERANNLAKLYNRKTRSLKVKCLGDVRVREGCGVGLAISALENEGIPTNQMVFVSEATHTISKGIHTMDLTLEVV